MVVTLYAAVNAASSPPYLSVRMCEISTGAQKLEGHSLIEKFRRDVASLVPLGLVTAAASMEVFPFVKLARTTSLAQRQTQCLVQNTCVLTNLAQRQTK